MVNMSYIDNGMKEKTKTKEQKGGMMVRAFLKNVYRLVNSGKVKAYLDPDDKSEPISYVNPETWWVRVRYGQYGQWTKSYACTPWTVIYLDIDPSSVKELGISIIGKEG